MNKTELKSLLDKKEKDELIDIIGLIQMLMQDWLRLLKNISIPAQRAIDIYCCMQTSI